MRILAVIPCRRNSSRVPGKNTMTIGGKPNLLWTIEALRECSYTPRIVVLTDDPAAVAIADGAGVEVVDEPPAIAADDNLWIAHDFVMRSLSGPFDCLMAVQATSPIRPPGFFDALIDKLRATQCDGVTAVAKVPPHCHPHFLNLLIDGDRPVSIALGPISNSQAFTPLYCYTGLGSIWTWANAQNHVADRWTAARTADTRVIEVPADQWVDIDDPLDVEWAEFLLARRAKRERTTELCDREQLQPIESDGGGKEAPGLLSVGIHL